MVCPECHHIRKVTGTHLHIRSDGGEGCKCHEGNLLRVEVHHNGLGAVHHPVLEVAAVLHVESVPAAS